MLRYLFCQHKKRKLGCFSVLKTQKHLNLNEQKNQVVSCFSLLSASPFRMRQESGSFSNPALFFAKSLRAFSVVLFSMLSYTCGTCAEFIDCVLRLYSFYRISFPCKFFHLQFFFNLLNAFIRSGKILWHSTTNILDGFPHFLTNF